MKTKNRTDEHRLRVEAADHCNERLAGVGVEERWEFDCEAGTWWCGDVGGVTEVREIEEATGALISEVGL